MDKSLEKKFVKTNTFSPNAKGFVIMDTLNNPEFPLSNIILDKSKFDSNVVLDEYRRIYNMSKAEIFMPWHYQVEFVGRDYTIQMTRPYNYLSGMKKYPEQICICLVGNSNDDVYTPEIYKKIANICIKPHSRAPVNKVPEDILYLTGKSFFKQQIDKML